MYNKWAREQCIVQEMFQWKKRFKIKYRGMLQTVHYNLVVCSSRDAPIAKPINTNTENCTKDKLFIYILFNKITRRSLMVLCSKPGSEWNFTEVTGTPGFRASHQSIEPSSYLSHSKFAIREGDQVI